MPCHVKPATVSESNLSAGVASTYCRVPCLHAKERERGQEPFHASGDVRGRPAALDRERPEKVPDPFPSCRVRWTPLSLGSWSVPVGPQPPEPFCQLSILLQLTPSPKPVQTAAPIAGAAPRARADTATRTAPNLVMFLIFLLPLLPFWMRLCRVSSPSDVSAQARKSQAQQGQRRRLGDVHRLDHIDTDVVEVDTVA